MTTAAAQSHQFAPVHSISFNTSASSGYPSRTASRNPFTRSRIHVFMLVMLNPNRPSSLNCAYQEKGNPSMLNAMPVKKRKPAIAKIELPNLALKLSDTQQNAPQKSTASSTTPSTS